MPIREVSVFKDGHAFVLHSGEVETDADGNVLFDYLPSPVLGTFWPFADDERVKLKSVAAGKQRIELEKTATSMRELLIANIGARVEIREKESQYRATIVGIPTISAEELESTAPAGSGPHLAQQGQLILLQTENGTRAIPIERIQDVTFIDRPMEQFQAEEIRDLLKLDLDWRGKKPEAKVRVGMTYLQKGLRWIPQYKLHLLGDGTVQVQLQATLINELADLHGVNVNLVVGVPSFDFKTSIDPIALRDAVAQLSAHFQENSQTAYAFSNSFTVQTQMRAISPPPVPSSGSGDGAFESSLSGIEEETFLFALQNVTLAKGQRMVLKVGEWTMPVKDVFRLELPMAPPLEVRQGFSSSQELELAQLFHAPKVKQILRITNTQQIPLTTAPALITSEKGVLGQGMMTYTSPGSAVDVGVTTAVNVSVSNQDEEIKRTPEAFSWREHRLSRIDLRGMVRLTNFRNGPIEVEVERTVLGDVNSVGAEGTFRKLSGWDERLMDRPVWWSWYAWPQWWTQKNVTSQINWQVTVGAGQTIELPYEWYYYWSH
jgi:hypothetical protein